MNRKVTVEICVGDLESALAAGQGGADRIELCDHLSVGGTTPGAGTIAEACRRLEIPVHVLNGRVEELLLDNHVSSQGARQLGECVGLAALDLGKERLDLPVLLFE